MAFKSFVEIWILIISYKTWIYPGIIWVKVAGLTTLNILLPEIGLSKNFIWCNAFKIQMILGIFVRGLRKIKGSSGWIYQKTQFR